MSNIKIYHNPNCSTSRNVLALIRYAGFKPDVIEYLKKPPSRKRLQELAALTGLGVRGLLRQKGTPYDELGLGDESLPDSALLDALEKHPILLHRPIVVTPTATRLCRPSELVLEILPGGKREPEEEDDT